MVSGAFWNLKSSIILPLSHCRFPYLFLSLSQTPTSLWSSTPSSNEPLSHLLKSNPIFIILYTRISPPKTSLLACFVWGTIFPKVEYSTFQEYYQLSHSMHDHFLCPSQPIWLVIYVLESFYGLRNRAPTTKRLLSDFVQHYEKLHIKDQ